jgi:hypothetical protein
MLPNPNNISPIGPIDLLRLLSVFSEAFINSLIGFLEKIFFIMLLPDVF